VKRLFGNVGILAGAFLITLVICFRAETERMVEVDCEVPVRYANLPDSLILVGEPPGRLYVRALFNRRFWQTKPDYLTAEVDLSRIKRGSQAVTTTPELVQIPPDRKARIIEVLAPDRLPLTLEAKKRKRVPVVPVPEGAPAEGYALFGAPQSDPARVVVTGAQSALDSISEARTAPVSISGATDDVKSSVAVSLPGHPSVRFDPATVEVRFDVERVEDRVLQRRPVRFAPRERIDFAPESIDLVVRGPSAAVGLIQEARTRLAIDLSALPPGQHDVVAVVSEGNRVRFEADAGDADRAPRALVGEVQNLPDSVLLVDISPKRFTIRRRGM
jgi:hypothetical protein